MLRVLPSGEGGEEGQVAPPPRWLSKGWQSKGPQRSVWPRRPSWLLLQTPLPLPGESSASDTDSQSGLAPKQKAGDLTQRLKAVVVVGWGEKHEPLRLCSAQVP